MTGDGTLGHALREARQQAGHSTARFAKLLNVSDAYVRSIENGNRPATHEIVEAYDSVLGTGGLLVDLYVAERNGDDMRRRTVLALLGMAASAGVAAPPVFVEALRDRLLASLDLDDWEEIALDYGHRFMIDEPEELQRELTADLLVLRLSLTESDTLTARSAAPRLMLLNGMLLANTGDAQQGARWYRAARLAADRTDDTRLRQWVRGREAFRRGYEGADPREIVRIGESVDDVEAQLAVAQAYARLGEPKLAERGLSDARRIYERADQNEETIFAMPPWRMALSSAYVYALKGDVEHSESELAEVHPPASVARWEAQLEIQRAVALSHSGDQTAGSQLANLVMRATPAEERSVVLSEMCREAKKPAMPS
jgi:transcriptional regulator with XRE-family HTH domain